MPAPATAALKRCGLGDAEHGHEAAVAPAGEAFAVVVDGGELALDGVDAAEDVAEVAVAEVLDVGGGELLALAEAAAGVGVELEVAELGPEAAAPAGVGGGGGTAVDLDDDGVLLGGIVVGGVGEPALDVEALVGPLDGLDAGVGGVGVVEVGDLGEVRRRGRPRARAGCRGRS